MGKKKVETIICEGCEKKVNLELCTTDADGTWLCPECMQSLMDDFNKNPFGYEEDGDGFISDK